MNEHEIPEWLQDVIYRLYSLIMNEGEEKLKPWIIQLIEENDHNGILRHYVDNFMDKKEKDKEYLEKVRENLIFKPPPMNICRELSKIYCWKK